MHLHKPTLSSKNSSHQAHCADTLTMRAQPAANTVYSFSAAMPVNTQLLECVCVGVYCDWESRLKSTHSGLRCLFLVTRISVRWDKGIWAAIYFSEAHEQWQLSHSTQTQITCACCLTRRLLSTAVNQRSEVMLDTYTRDLHACPGISRYNLRWMT